MSDIPGYREEKKPQAGAAVATGVSKIIELQAESPKGWEAAVQLCIAEAVRTLRNVNSVTVHEFSASINEDAIQTFQVKCRVAFGIDDTLRAH